MHVVNIPDILVSDGMHTKLNWVSPQVKYLSDPLLVHLPDVLEIPFHWADFHLTLSLQSVICSLRHIFKGMPLSFLYVRQLKFDFMWKIMALLVCRKHTFLLNGIWTLLHNNESLITAWKLHCKIFIMSVEYVLK